MTRPAPSASVPSGSETFPTRAVLAITGLAALYLGVFSWRTGRFMDSDEAIFGLMAHEIVHGRQFPVYYWGQEYLGAFESYLAAPIFALFGQTPQALRVITVGFYLAFIPAAADLAFMARGRRFAIVAAAVLATPPVAYVVWATKMHQFTEAGAASFIFMWLCFRILRCPDRRRQLAWAAAGGLLFGIGLWWSYLILIYAAPGLLALVLHPAGRRPAIWGVAALLAIVGASPAIERNAVVTHWATVLHTVRPDEAQRALGHQPEHAVPEQAARSLREIALPAFLGFHDARTQPYRLQLPQGLWELALMIISAAGLVLCLAHGLRRDLSRLARLATLAPMVGGALMIVAFVFTRFGFEREPRYVMPLYLAVGFTNAWTLDALIKRVRPLGVALLVALMGYMTWGTYGRESARDVVQWNPRAPSNLTLLPLANRLEAMGHTHILADYWTSMRITFESEGRVLAIDPNDHRADAIAAPTLQDPRACWLSTPGNQADQMVRARGWQRTVFEPKDVEGLLAPQVLACPP